MTNVKTTKAKGKVTDLATYIHLATELHKVSGLTQATSQLWFRGQSDRTWDLS